MNKLRLFFLTFTSILALITMYIPGSLGLPKFLQDPRVWILLIIITLLVSKTKKSFFRQLECIESKISKRVIFIVVNFIFWHFWLRRMMSYYQFSISGADFSHFDYAVWNASNGFGLDVSIGETTFYYADLLGNHFSPILYLFTIPFFFFDSHQNLQVIQALIGVSSFLAFYYLFKDYLKIKNNKTISLILSLSFVFSKYFLKIIAFEFHHEFLYVPLSIYLFYSFFKSKEKTGWDFYLCLLLLLLVKEDSGLIVLGFGLAGLFFKKNKWLPSALIVLGPIYTILCFKAIMPYFYKPDFLETSSSFTGLWAKYGASLPEIAKNVVIKPHWVLSDVLSSKVFYFFILVTLGLPLFSFAFLSFVPMLVMHLISVGPTKDLLLYYSAAVIGLIFSSVATGIQNIKKNDEFKTFLLLGVAFLSFVMGIGNYRLGRAHPQFSKIKKEVHEVYSHYNQKDEVFIDGNIIPLIDYSRKFRRIFSRDFVNESPNYILMTEHFNSFPINSTQKRDIINELIASDLYRLEKKIGKTYLFKKL